VLLGVSLVQFSQFVKSISQNQSHATVTERWCLVYRRLRLVEVHVRIVLIMANLMVVPLKHQYSCKVKLRPAIIVVVMSMILVKNKSGTMSVMLSSWQSHCRS